MGHHSNVHWVDGIAITTLVPDCIGLRCTGAVIEVLGPSLIELASESARAPASSIFKSGV